MNHSSHRLRGASTSLLGNAWLAGQIVLGGIVVVASLSLLWHGLTALGLPLDAWADQAWRGLLRRLAFWR